MSDDPKARGAPPEYVKVEKTRRSPLLWLLLAVLALAILIFLLSQCGHQRTAPAPTDATPAPAATPAAPPAASTTAISPAPSSTATPAASAGAEPGTSGLPAYLAGQEATPRTFVFERLHFDTAQSTIRPEDQAEVRAAADALKSGAARVRIVGYADSTGGSQANQKLGMDRANAVKAAMVARGVDAGRIDTASGGETNPVETNATSGGRAENRRTKLIVLQR